MGFLSSILPAVAGGLTALIPGVGPMLSPIVAGAASAFTASSADATSQSRVREAAGVAQASADKQMSFQERMSGTSYQRGMEDMRAAGLNPMLAYTQGGASVPGGASAGMGVATAIDAGTIGQTTARELKTANLSNRLTAEQTKLVGAQTNSAHSSAVIRKAEEKRAKWEADWIASPEGALFERIKRASEAVGTPAASAYFGFKHRGVISQYLKDLPTMPGLDHQGAAGWKERSKRLSKDNKLWRSDRDRLKR